MYKLSDVMLQALEKDLRKFHELFQGGRCQAWQLEELIAKAINSDFNARDKAFWKGNGHDIEADIEVGNFKISVKSGKIEDKTKTKPERLILSGHRLSRFEGNLDEITKFLNNNNYLLIAVPYNVVSKNGKQHNYQLIYMDASLLKPTKWNAKYSKNGTKISKYDCINDNGVYCSINPTMSWQVWWEIPITAIPEQNKSRVISIS